MAGIGYIMILAVIVRYYGEPLFKHWGKLAKPSLGWDFLRFLTSTTFSWESSSGVILTNTIGIPKWAASGVKTAPGPQDGRHHAGHDVFDHRARLPRPALHRHDRHLRHGNDDHDPLARRHLRHRPLAYGNPLVGARSLRRLGGRGGRSVVRAKSIDMAYSIGTVLLIGVIFLFIFPPVGQIFSMSPIQFGAWAGTGILNSAQVAAAALIYDPKGIETLKVAEIFNITRVLFLPLIVILLAVWFPPRARKRPRPAERSASGRSSSTNSRSSSSGSS